jgi:hypothetical protein
VKTAIIGAACVLGASATVAATLWRENVSSCRTANGDLKVLATVIYVQYRGPHITNTPKAIHDREVIYRAELAAIDRTRCTPSA